MEIGGYLEFETFNGPEYHTGAIRLNSGRNCLAYLLEARNIRKIHLPYYLCSSVREVCAKYGVEIHYYHVNEDFTPKFDFELSSSDYFYLVNYYGQISNVYIKNLAQNIKNLIVDNSQAFFQMPVDGIDTLYTCRKFFGVPDGAYLYTNVILEHTLQQDVSYYRMQHLLGRFEEDASSHYEEYRNNENVFEQVTMLCMSKLTQNLLKGIDYNRVKATRERNFSFLHENLQSINQLQLKDPIGAFSYPLLLEDGEKIRKRMQENKIYIPMLWPDILDRCDRNSVEYHYARNILPVPCDQRYSENDMIKLLEEFIQCIS